MFSAPVAGNPLIVWCDAFNRAVRGQVTSTRRAETFLI
jgi:hypothetical protein